MNHTVEGRCRCNRMSVVTVGSSTNDPLHYCIECLPDELLFLSLPDRNGDFHETNFALRRDSIIRMMEVRAQILENWC